MFHPRAGIEIDEPKPLHSTVVFDFGWRLVVTTVGPGMMTLPPAGGTAFNAAWIATVSSVTPSSTAPKATTLYVIGPPKHCRKAQTIAAQEFVYVSIPE